jgi:preprotein translocase subunit YajC
MPHGLILRPEFQNPQEQGPPPIVGRDAADPGSTGTAGQGQPAPQGPMGSPCGTEQILLMVGMLAIFYFLLIRPQQKQEKARRALIASVRKGDKVVTNGGIWGQIASIDEGKGTVTLRIDSDGKTRLTVDRAAIGRVVRDDKESDTDKSE